MPRAVTRPTPAAFSHDGQSSGECATRSRLDPFRSPGRFSGAASFGVQTGSRSAANKGSATRPGQSPSPSLMPQLQSSPKGAAAPPVVMRTSIVGLLLAEIRQPRDQPAHRESRADADGQHAHDGRRRHLRGQARQRIEDRRQPALIGAPRRRQRQPVGLALEQRDAEPLLQQVHHPADRRRRNVELAARRGETAAARGGFECLDAVEKEQAPHMHPQES